MARELLDPIDPEDPEDLAEEGLRDEAPPLPDATESVHTVWRGASVVKCEVCLSVIPENRPHEECPPLVDPHRVGRAWCDRACLEEALERCSGPAARTSLLAAVYGELCARYEERVAPDKGLQSVEFWLLCELSKESDLALREVS